MKMLRAFVAAIALILPLSCLAQFHSGTFNNVTLGPGITISGSEITCCGNTLQWSTIHIDTITGPEGTQYVSWSITVVGNPDGSGGSMTFNFGVNWVTANINMRDGTVTVTEGDVSDYEFSVTQDWGGSMGDVVGGMGGSMGGILGPIGIPDFRNQY